jgi:hypothetical protein
VTIFILDTDLKKSVEYLDDDSLNAQIADTAWILCNTHYESTKEVSNTAPWFKKTRGIPLGFNHAKSRIPWVRWTKKCGIHYSWMIDLGLASLQEYTHRFISYDYNHRRYSEAIEWAKGRIPNLCEEYPNCPPMELPALTPQRYLIGKYVCTEQGTVERPAAYTRIAGSDAVLSFRNYFKNKLLNRFNTQTKYDTAESFLLAYYTNRKAPEWLLR